MSEVWTRYLTWQAPSIDEIEFGVRVSDSFGGRRLSHHIDCYASLPVRWTRDEQTGSRL